MSHLRVKTEYEDIDAKGNTEIKTLYAHHNNSCDVVTFYDNDGDFMFSMSDTGISKDIVFAINKLSSPMGKEGKELDSGVEYMSINDSKKIGLIKQKL